MHKQLPAGWREAFGWVLAVVVLMATFPAEAVEDREPTVVFLVRHAEKAAPADAMDSADPPLTGAGRTRARELAGLLAPSGLDGVFSTDYRRTRQTAAPVAEATGLNVTLYDPGDLQGFANRLRNRAGRFLVVGHSNTTPELVTHLGGEAGEPIDEGSEYDRLYIVVLEGGDTVTSIRQSYGHR